MMGQSVYDTALTPHTVIANDLYMASIEEKYKNTQEVKA